MRAVTISVPLPTGSGAAFCAEAAPARVRTLAAAIRAAAVFIGIIPDNRRIEGGSGFDVENTVARRLIPTP
ncbi:hypothetical protein D3C71_703620 [compost metagenome]